MRHCDLGLLECLGEGEDIRKFMCTQFWIRKKLCDLKLRNMILTKEQIKVLSIFVPHTL
jgi:hypothetical protein